MGSWGWGAAGREMLLPTLRVCATPWMAASVAGLALGTGLAPPEEPAWGCHPEAGGGGKCQEHIAPPVSTQDCPQGCRRPCRRAGGRGGRATRGALVRGWHGSGEGGRGVQVGEPWALSTLITDPPGRGCGTCRNSGFNYLCGAAGNQQAGRGCGYMGMGHLGGGGSEGLI